LNLNLDITDLKFNCKTPLCGTTHWIPMDY